ncbi:hypothetical protein JHN63_50640 [Streptomyces sp. MBT65]|uniref:hypothetical protein n=1 Tax=Streptomyces sp. MBT65 TaxID=1488395 RepID=UPI00190AB814|nr:hypothetical protein [Streptomyces sp. MBT65]MBK3581867.1 hypothetical protein [Streptomyces sp. MBT65]
MASRASSEAPADGTPIHIPALPKLGRTWYKRGALYWLCRVRTTAFLLVLMGAVSFFALALYQGFTSEWSPTVRLVWNWATGVASCGALGWGWVTQRREHRKALLDPPTPAQTIQAKRDHNRQAPAKAFAGRWMVLLLVPVLPALAAYTVGWLAAWTTVREYPSEVGARRWLQEHPTGT